MIGMHILHFWLDTGHIYNDAISDTLNERR